MPTRRGAQIDTMLLCLQAIEQIGYRIHNFSSLKIEALRQHSLNVPRVSERHATFKNMDMVRRVCYIYGMPYPQRCETMESILVQTLHYIDNDRGYTIRDINYWQWRQARVAAVL